MYDINLLGVADGGSLPPSSTRSAMYLCICCNITEKDLEQNPELINYIGSVCGACVSDGAEYGFDGAHEILMDNSPDHDTIE